MDDALSDQWRGVTIAAVAVVATVALGMIGFAAHPAYATGYDALDYFYLSIQLFILQSGAVGPPISPALQIARFLAPTLAAWATVRALTAIFRAETDILLARLNRQHVIVCGGGAIGRFLTSELRAKGRRVTIIEKHWDPALFAQLRRTGARVLAGDATDPHVLQRGGVARAADIIALCGDDTINAQVAVVVRSLTPSGSRPAPLRCFVAVDDADLGRLLQADTLNGVDVAARVEFVSLAERAAKAMLDLNPPAHPAGKWLVIGDGPVARELGDQANVRARTADGERLLFPLDGMLTPDLAQPGAVAVAYVSTPDDAAGLRAALRVMNQLSPETPVVLRQRTTSAWPALLQAPGRAALRVFSQLEQSCRPEQLMVEVNEALASATHDMYLEDQRRRGATPATNSSMVEWDALPETLRRANRAQAAHIGLSLRTIGCIIVPAPAIAAVLTPDEIELLARSEHTRWYLERQADRWTVAPGPKNAAAKTHPHMVAWESLGEDVKDLDRAAIKALPHILERHGFVIYRRLVRAGD